MSDDQIATALGQIMGKLDALTAQFHDYTASHDDRHTKIDAKIDEHAAEIHRAQGAKGALLAAAATISAVVGALGAKIGRLFS